MGATWTTPFRTVLDEVLASVGLAYDSSNQTQLDLCVNFINRRMAQAWDYQAWKETARSEERAFADEWNEDIPYSDGDVVYSSTQDAYYEATAATVPAGTAVTDTDYWAEDDRPTDSLIEWDQYNDNEIGRVWKITDADIRGDTKWESYDFLETNTGIYVKDCTADTVWVYFNLRPPQFSPKAHATSGVTYAVGDIVYSPAAETTGKFPYSGECYKAYTDEDGNQVWQLVEFPARFAPYVTAAASADMMRLYGQKEAAQERLAEARMYLQEESTKEGGGAEIEIRLGI
jgi:hypothetical protein